MLRIGIDGGTDDMWRAHWRAVEEAETTCEDCGAEGHKSPGGGSKIRCDRCHQVADDLEARITAERLAKRGRRDSGIGGMM